MPIKYVGSKTSIINTYGKGVSWKKERVECLFRPTQKHFVEHSKAGLICQCWKTAEELELEAA